jgi:hypothetical protein
MAAHQLAYRTSSSGEPMTIEHLESTLRRVAQMLEPLDLEKTPIMSSVAIQLENVPMI